MENEGIGELYHAGSLRRLWWRRDDDVDFWFRPPGNAEVGFIERAAEEASVRIVPGRHNRHGLRPRGGSDEDIGISFAAEGETGGLLRGRGDAALDFAIGIVAHNARAVPLRRPKEAFLIDCQTVGQSLGGRDFHEHSAIPNVAGVLVVVIRENGAVHRIGEIEGAIVRREGQTVGEMKALVQNGDLPVAIDSHEFSQCVWIGGVVVLRTGNEPAGGIRGTVVHLTFLAIDPIGNQRESVGAVPVPDTRVVGNDEPARAVQPEAGDLQPLLDDLVRIGAWIVAIEFLTGTIGPVEETAVGVLNGALAAKILVIGNYSHGGVWRSGLA